MCARAGSDYLKKWFKLTDQLAIGLQPLLEKAIGILSTSERVTDDASGSGTRAQTKPDDRGGWGREGRF